MRKTLFLLAALAAGSAGESPAQANVAQIVERVKPSVVLLKVYNQAGRQTGLGSGFAIQDGRVVTNAHVIRGAANVEIFDHKGSLVGTAHFAEALSNSVDIAILPRVSGLTGLALASGEPAVGSGIVVIGAPEGLANTVSNGIVSSVRDIEGQRLMQISAPISPGSSGGPVLSMSGEVVGVSVSSRAGQNLNFAVPVSNVAVLANSAPGQLAFTTATGGASFTGSGTAGPAAATPIVPNAPPTRGFLSDEDEVLEDNSYFDAYSFTGKQGDRIVVALTSTDFDAYLIVGRVSNGRFIKMHSNDDVGGRSLNSRVVFTLPIDGEYMVYANTVAPEQIGAYQIRVESSSR